jgi:transposase
MDRFIGLDAHSQSCTFAVLDERGRVLKTGVVETNGQSLVEFVKLVPGNRYLCLEEGNESQWLSEILRPYVSELAVVTCTKRRGNKNDTLDAEGLAERMRTGALGVPVFKPPAKFVALREMARSYAMLTNDVVRTKNRIKSFYHSRAVPVGSRREVYDAATREERLKLLRPATRTAVEPLCEVLDQLEAIKARMQEAFVRAAASHPDVSILRSAPGIGPVRAAQLLAVVVTPHRFRTSRQFWSYCGLGIVMRSSSDWTQAANGQWQRSSVQKTRGLNANHNHVCKAIFKDAATTVIAKMRTDPLFADYQRLLENGTKPNLAKLTLARRIASTTLAMWKKGESYNPEKYRRAKR